MKITIYELLGLVKDGKAPKKIKYNDILWIYSNENQDYLSLTENDDLFGHLFTNLSTNGFINDEVEIIEEQKKIEKISWGEKESLAMYFTTSEEILARRTEKLKSSLNELIDEINNLKEDD